MWKTAVWLGLSEGHWKQDQDMPLVHELACWRIFPVVGVKLNLNAGGRGLILPQLIGPGIVDFIGALTI